MNLEYDDKYGYHMPLKVDKCFGILPSKRCFFNSIQRDNHAYHDAN
jgi:hypothetical protein